MIFGITRFELRYQLRNPVFWVAAAIFFLLGFGLTASANVSIGTPGGVHKNAANAIAAATAIFSLFYVFVVTAFVANAIIRDDASGFAPIVRATAVTPRQIVAGRFLGGLLIAWLGYLALPLGLFLGSVMPWVDPETVGPQVISYYAWPFLIFALPNIFLLCAVLFSLATMLRSMMGAYIAAIVLVMGYLVITSILGQKIEYREAVARWEPLGTGAVEEATRYWTQSELNSRLIELSGNVLFNRIWALALGVAFLGFLFWRFTMTERPPSRRRLRKLAKRQQREATIAAVTPELGGGAVVARDMRPSRAAQFMSRLRIELRQVLTSPGLIVLLFLSVAFTGVNLWLGQSAYGTSDYPTVSATIQNVDSGSTLFLLMIAAFFGGELVWRERDRKINELIDSTAVPSWVMTVPKVLAIFLVLMLVNVAAALTGVYQLAEGARTLGLLQFVTSFILPVSIDALQIAVLAVFVQVLSPNKYVGWGILFVWFVLGIFLNNLGYGNPLYNYGRTPQVPMSDFVGTGSFWFGAAVLRFYWLCFAIVLAVIAHLLWPRGTDLAVRARIRRAPRMASLPALAILGVAGALMAATGAYAYYNIKVLNRYETSDDAEKASAQFERKYLKYEKVPQPSVTKVALDVQLHPRQRMMVTRGSYVLRNAGKAPIAEVHVRNGDPRNLQWLALDVAGARLASDDKDFGYRIYHFERPLAPGATTTLRFTSRVWHRGFRASRPATDVIENGTFINNSDFAPIIGMDRNNLLTDRVKRRRQGLPAELRPAKLEDMRATEQNYAHADWVMSDISVTTDADQVPVAPGNQVSDSTANGRRTARFVSPAPILNFFSVQSARYRVASEDHNGLKLSVYYHPGHDWNVPKMLRAMAAALDYCRANFGPYQFGYARIIEFPGYSRFAQAFAGTMPYSETIGFNANTNDPDKIDFTTYVVAHEMGHQYWAHQVIGADMQGATSMSETLAQYSALMVMKRLYGPDKIRRFLKYELDNYLRSRAGEAVEEVPLERVENQDYVHYRKGAVAMYLLQERLGEQAVNRALSRFLAKWRFKGPPYPRSADMIAEFRKEASTPEQQQLITDLFQKISLYDLKVTEAQTRKVGSEWMTTLTVQAEKYYASGKGEERKAKLAEPIDIGLFTARPGLGAFSAENVVLMEQQRVRSGVQKITLRTKVKPAFAGVDPYNFYIDRNSDDNVKAVTSGT